jgi:hypothetical protein
MCNFEKFELRTFESKVLNFYKIPRPQIKVSEAIDLFDSINGINNYETLEKTETIESIENSLIKNNRLQVSKGMYKTA